MIHDRYGTISRGTYTFYPGILLSAEYYGLDPEDPVYRTRTSHSRPYRSCRVCRHHDERDPRFPCDVMMARARDMEAEGYPATFCRSCGYTMPVREGQSPYSPRCFHCDRMAAKHEQMRRRADRVADGLGCVDRIHPTERIWWERYG